MDSSGLDGLTVFPPRRVLEKERGEWREMRGGQEQKEELGGKQWVKEERRGLCAEGPEPKASHPEDLCSLAGWRQRETGERGHESKGEKEKKKGAREKKVHGRGRERAGGIAREDWA